MIEIKIANGDTYSYIDGNIATISADVITAIHTIYEQMREENEDGAQAFKDVFLDHVELAFCGKNELDKTLTEKRAKLKKLKEQKEESKKQEVKKTLSEIVQMLDDGESLDDVVEFLEKEIKK